ncbi:UNVERIFIED_CONTAM: hypothetical protein FKN15_053033 [Acipenser sinensis]
MIRQEVNEIASLLSCAHLQDEKRNMSRYTIYSLLDWVYGGVDPKFEGNGGPECAAFLSFNQRLGESIVIILASAIEIIIALRKIQQCKELKEMTKAVCEHKKEESFGKNLLLVALCLTFGVELGFKFATKTLIYLLNPCHVVTMVQSNVVSSRPRGKLALLERGVHTSYFSFGDACPWSWGISLDESLVLVLAAISCLLMFVLSCCLQDAGTHAQWSAVGPSVPCCQHQAGVYTAEPLGDFSWALLSSGLLFFYHFTFLQTLGLVTEVNLNNMLCPAVSDPFYGPWYRVWATGHQTALMLLHGKILTGLFHCAVPSYQYLLDGVRLRTKKIH